MEELPVLLGPVVVEDEADGLGVVGFTSKLPSLFELLFLGLEPPLKL